MNKNTEESKSKPQPKTVVSNRIPKVFYGPGKAQERSEEGKSKKEPPSVGLSEDAELKKVIKHIRKIPIEEESNPVAKKKREVTLEDLITISLLQSSPISVKKAVTASSLKLYIVKSVSIANRDEREALKTLIKNWKTAQAKSSRLTWICASFWNNPEGCVSVIMEPMGGNLIDIVNLVGSLPEKLLAHMAKRTLQILSAVNTELFDNFNLMFDREGKVKLGLSLSVNPPRRNCIQQLGYLILWAALGDANLLESSSEVNCCLFHSLEPSPLIGRFTPQLREFLCLTLRGESSLDTLLRLQWVNMREHPGPDLYVKDFINIMTGNSGEVPGVSQLERICSSIGIHGKLGDSPSQEALKELADELGLPSNIVEEYVQKAFAS